MVTPRKKTPTKPEVAASKPAPVRALFGPGAEEIENPGPESVEIISPAVPKKKRVALVPSVGVEKRSEEEKSPAKGQKIFCSSNFLIVCSNLPIFKLSIASSKR